MDAQDLDARLGTFQRQCERAGETLGYATPVGSTIAGLMFLAVLQIGDDLVDPFADTIHDVPLNAMCRTIEIDLLQAIGDEAPEPLQPVRGVLW